MNETAKSPITLLNWNIVEFEAGSAIFVGLRRSPPNFVMQHAAEDGWFRLDCSFRNSTTIEHFDPSKGIGHTQSGRRYVLLGKPSDTTGLIRKSVETIFKNDKFKYRYKFDDEIF
ncbi:MAG: hypothetical protein JJU48_03100 [Methylophaga sp.]|nr:hypothetical protein [Methylophaga sp.]